MGGVAGNRVVGESVARFDFASNGNRRRAGNSIDDGAKASVGCSRLRIQGKGGTPSASVMQSGVSGEL